MARYLYCDGGVVQVNPSPIGGVFAWCLVEDDQMLTSGSGFIPATEGPVSNNVSELRAAVEALEAMPSGWQGTLCSDSQVTLGRVFQNWPLKGVPVDLANRLRSMRVRLAWDLQGVNCLLLQGHPTKADLARGIGAKRKLPVSKWNCWCDKRCQELAAEQVSQKQYGKQWREEVVAC